MNANKRSTIFIKLKKRLMILVSFILMLLVLVIALTHLNTKSQRDTRILLDTISKQRVYTQQINKDAFAIAFNANRQKDAESIEIRIAYEHALNLSKGSLQKTSLSFEYLLKQLNTGQLQTGKGTLKLNEEMGKAYTTNLKALNDNWQRYEQDVRRILTQPSESASFKAALTDLESQTGILTNNCEAIIKALEDQLDARYKNYQGIVLLAIALLLLSAMLTLYELYRYLFIPLEELYAGFSEMGIGYSQNFSDHQDKDFIVQEVRHIFTSLKQIMHLMEQISLSASFEESLQNIFDTFKDYIPYTYVGIALFKSGDEDRLVASYGVSSAQHKDLANQLLGLSVRVEDTSLSRILDQGTPRMINDYERYFENRKINQYSRILLDNGIRASITLPLKVNQKSLGFIFFSSDTKNIYKPSHVKFLEMVSDAIAISFEKNIYVDDLLYASVLALAKLAEARDEDTGAHLNRMKRYTLFLTNLMKDHPEFKSQINPQFLIDIEKFSPMHDIGKVGVGDRILLKPGKLTPEEFDSMKYHTVFGANVLKEAEENLNRSNKSLFKMGIEIAGAHHEKWDGSGYPNGLKGEEIPLSARIVALADVLDALLSKRPYKEPFTFAQACEVIAVGRGNHFDPRIVDLFFENLERFKYMHENSILEDFSGQSTNMNS